MSEEKETQLDRIEKLLITINGNLEEIKSRYINVVVTDPKEINGVVSRVLRDPQSS